MKKITHIPSVNKRHWKIEAKVLDILKHPEKYNFTKDELKDDWHHYINVDGVEYFITHWWDICNLNVCISKPGLVYTWRQGNPEIDLSHLIYSPVKPTTNARKRHRLYPEFLSLLNDDSDFADTWQDRDADFFEWAMDFEVDNDWEVNNEG